VRRITFGIVAAAALLVGSAPAAAQELYSYTVSGLGGLGGSFDAERGDGIDSPALQAGFSMVTEPSTHVGVRVGRIAFDESEPLESLFDAELTYLTLAGEYRFDQGFYRSGIYLGLGGYRLEGTRPGEGAVEDTSLGLAVGLTGEVEINRHFGLLLEFSGHYADLDETQMFVLAQGGVAFHF
jgi:hypothetical protein